jgi:CheY-like chemotaxis protein
VIAMDKNLLIVDDDETIVFTVKHIFESKGYNVSTALSGQECISVLKKGFKGVILMDVMMPVMDGWDTIRKIKESGLMEGNIISMLTAKDDPDEKMDPLKEYIIDYIRKPFNSEEIIKTVEQFFGYLNERKKK